VVTGASSPQPLPPEGDASFGDSTSGGETDAASSCHPSDVLTFVQGSYQPAAAPSAACLGTDGGGLWEDFYEACLGPNKKDANCNAYKETPSNAACATCVLTPYTADQLGPILSFGQFVGANVAGCIEVTAPTDPTALQCAKKVQALTDCENAACQANCPVTDQVSFTGRQHCAELADQMGCQSFALNAASCQTDAGVAAPCGSAAFKAFYDVVVPLFCGQLAVDAAAGFDAGGADALPKAPVDGGVPAFDAGTD